MNEVTPYGTKMRLHFPFPISHFTARTRSARASRPVWRAAEPQHASPSGSDKQCIDILCAGLGKGIHPFFVLRSVGQAWEQVHQMIRFYLLCAQNKKEASYIDIESTILCVSPIMASLVLTGHKLLKFPRERTSIVWGPCR